MVSVSVELGVCDRRNLRFEAEFGFVTVANHTD